MPGTTTPAREARLRRLADRHGRRLVKVRTNSRQFAEYGPYCLVDHTTNSILERSLDLDDVERVLLDL